MNMLRDMLQPTRRNMLRSMFASTSTLTRFAVNGVEAALALDFVGSEYRTANTTTTFADAFTGTSPKLTYSTAAGSNSTMVNSAGNIVWAPHNLVDYSEDFSNAAWTKQGSTAIDSTLVTGPDGTLSGRRLLDFDSGTSDRLVGRATITNATVTCSLWVKGEGSNIGKDIQLKAKRVGGTFVQTTVLHTLTADWERIHATFTQDPSNTGARLALSNPVNGNEASEVLIYGAHIYRSDLGGMAPVPGAEGDFQYYVPTNGNAEYLPRVGHHVYNGSTWVNEGLLIESEPRTNLVTHSEDFTAAEWLASNTAPLAINSIGPDGKTSAVTLSDSGAGGTGQVEVRDAGVPVVELTTYTASFFAKADQLSIATIRLAGGFNLNIVSFDLSSGEVLSGSGSIEDFGNGWYRCSVTATTKAGATSIDFRIILSETAGNLIVNLDGTSSILIYGAQLDQGQVVNGTPVDAPTPSSYMPTNGGTFTRTAQSLTVPPAEFGWPEPEYIGPELVVDGSGNWVGDFDVAADVSEWTGRNANTQLSLDGNRLRVEAGAADAAYAYKRLTADANKVYRVTLDYENVQGVVRVYAGIGPGTNTYYDSGSLTGSGSLDFVFVPTSADPYISVYASVSNTLGDASLFDNISVREINPLSVSIQMDGRMTYADDGAFVGQRLLHWSIDPFTGGDNFIDAIVRSDATLGQVLFRQREDGTNDEITSAVGVYSPGVNVPFNIASRHGSTFVNGAVDGVALTANTTPTALPDLSSTDLQIAYDFMGTIGTFRQFAGDIGDTGLVTATNPSTEPTLSLTFDGTDGSFYNLNWSE